MRILVSNDDGVHAPGIRALADAMQALGEVRVMAPDRNCSGASNSLTLLRPLSVQKLENGYYCVEGTPTDCVHLAVTGFFEDGVDMVVSGLNNGANLGDDVFYSGTVAAAMEGRYLGFPAIAFSMVGNTIAHYATGAAIARAVVSQVSSHPLPSQTLLNVNIPDISLQDIQGIQVTRLGRRHSAEPMAKTVDPRGRPVYWIGPPGAEADAEEGTDFYAVSKGYVSVTPLHLDMTHYPLFEPLSRWLDTITFS